jgi:hypothetical protein
VAVSPSPLSWPSALCSLLFALCSLPCAFCVVDCGSRWGGMWEWQKASRPSLLSALCSLLSALCSTLKQHYTIPGSISQHGPSLRYDYVRLHQPHVQFTAGEREWAISGTKPASHLAVSLIALNRLKSMTQHNTALLNVPLSASHSTDEYPLTEQDGDSLTF